MANQKSSADKLIDIIRKQCEEYVTHQSIHENDIVKEIVSSANDTIIDMTNDENLNNSIEIIKNADLNATELSLLISVVRMSIHECPSVTEAYGLGEINKAVLEKYSSTD